MAYPIPPGFHLYPDTERLFYASAGPIYIRRTGGKLQFGMSLTEKHMNAAMITHGGVLSFLMDMQLSVSAGFEAKLGGFATTVQMSTDFLAPSRVGDWLHGDARLVRAGRRLLVADGTITVNEDVPVLRGNAILTVARSEDGWNLADYLPPEYVPDDGAGG